MFLAGVLMACNTQDKKTGDTDANGEPTKKISKRDLSITKANAYNDLFLDSATMEALSASKKFPIPSAGGSAAFTMRAIMSMPGFRPKALPSRPALSGTFLIITPRITTIRHLPVRRCKNAWAGSQRLNR